jgi:hypothetical protein
MRHAMNNNSTDTILAIDLGKFNSVLCRHEPAARNSTSTCSTMPDGHGCRRFSRRGQIRPGISEPD